MKQKLLEEYIFTHEDLLLFENEEKIALGFN